MVRLTKIYTKTGDGGESALVGGTRVRKSHPRFCAIGAVDEANAQIGMALSALASATATHIGLLRIQNDLFDLGADLATPGEPQGALRIEAGATARLETEIDALNETLGPLTSFILPGGTPAAACLHVARTAVRRAERKVVRLLETEPINSEILRYLNRLSDLLFQMARAENTTGNTQNDILWQPGKNR